MDSSGGRTNPELIQGQTPKSLAIIYDVGVFSIQHVEPQLIYVLYPLLLAPSSGQRSPRMHL